VTPDCLILHRAPRAPRRGGFRRGGPERGPRRGAAAAASVGCVARAAAFLVAPRRRPLSSLPAFPGLRGVRTSQQHSASCPLLGFCVILRWRAAGSACDTPQAAVLHCQVCVWGASSAPCAHAWPQQCHSRRAGSCCGDVCARRAGSARSCAGRLARRAPPSACAGLAARRTQDLARRDAARS